MDDVIQNGFIVPRWPLPSSVKMVVTTRNNGTSKGAYADLNLSDQVGDDAQSVRENRRYLRDALALPNEPLWLEQQHATGVVICEDSNASNSTTSKADASVSFKQGHVCAVMVADCLPVLFCDQQGTQVGVAHAGWKGLLAGVLNNTVKAFDCDPGNLYAWLGPAIGPDAFQVQDEVRDAFIALDENNALSFLPDNVGAWYCNLYQLARLRLESLGVTKIYGGHYCTYHDGTNFYSYRRDGVTGRIAALAWLHK